MTKVPDFPSTNRCQVRAGGYSMSVDSDKATIAAGIAAATAAVTAMARRESSSSGMAEEDVI